MTLTAGTDTYATMAEANTFNANFGNTAWASLEDANKEIYLRKATAYLDQVYKFKGDIYSDAQALAWPRTEFADPHGRVITGGVIPQAVKNAAAHAAYVLSQGVELLDTLDRGGQVAREKVGSLEVEYFASASGQKVFPQISAHLMGLTVGSGISKQAVRV